MADNGGNDPQDARSAKRELRTRLRAARRVRRSGSSADDRAREAEALRALLIPLAQDARCIASFEPLPTEPDVSAVNRALTGTRQVLVPITCDDLDLSWRDVASGADLGHDAIALADVVIVPALAIGPHGERLGQGGGSYDRALRRRRADATLVAVVFDDEIGLDVPREPHDEGVSVAVSPERLVRLQPLTTRRP